MMVSLSQIFPSLVQQITNAQQRAQIPSIIATSPNFATAPAYQPNPFAAYNTHNAAGTPMTPMTPLIGTT